MFMDFLKRFVRLASSKEQSTPDSNGPAILKAGRPSTEILGKTNFEWACGNFTLNLSGTPHS